MGKTGKYSHKMMGKEVGQAEVYAKPHDMQGNTYNPIELNRDEPKTSGMKIRGTGAATKGLLARGPMA